MSKSSESSLTVYKGAFVHSKNVNEIEFLPNATLVVDADGKITAFHNYPSEDIKLPADARVEIIKPGDFLIPGFIDTHNHAPQWPMRGRGQGLHILDWLEKITFPHEARFADPIYARKAYESCVDGFLRQGITTASYYGSSHAEATCILADMCLEKGQRAFVGKCNMDRNAPDSPVLTPRFAICCTPELLAGLGELATSDPTLAIQTHFNEAQQEIAFTRSLFPSFASEADLYASFNLLTPRSVLAHCTLMTERETQRLRDLRCGVAHCPVANMTVGGGFMAAPVAAFLRAGVKVGLGTDSGGGFSASMLDGVRQAIIAANARDAMDGGRGEEVLTLAQAFWLATAGGAEVLGLEGVVGRFAVGMEFDAVWVETGVSSGMTGVEEGEGLEGVWETFLMTGDDRNVGRVFVRGMRVK
ncbi:hypothetical protein WHR41_05755 [Cladosporium halotolerans]|uniref:Amidohydrolase-related domain-containing protein n=1 Tax=Cladosporium halotolerans TaxID=1052096 RepID=A0AB34KMU9_9PEZI